MKQNMRKFPMLISTSFIIVLLIMIYGCSIDSRQKVVEEKPPVITPIFIISRTSTPIQVENDPPLRTTPTSTSTNFPQITPTSITFPTNLSHDPLKIPTGSNILTVDLGNTMRLIDIETGNERKLFPFREWAKFVRWEKKGCQLLVVSSEREYFISNLEGEKIKSLFILTEPIIKNLGIYGEVIPSPDFEWFIAWKVDGKPFDERGPGSDYEVQNYLVYSSDFTKAYKKLTKNGGGWEVSWSPSGKLIAYSDYDENGIVQVYLYSLAGNDQIKLTNFSQKFSFPTNGNDIESINWSPNEKFMAVTYMNSESQKYRSTLIISIESKKVEYLQNDTRFLWWIDESSFLLRSLTVNNSDEIFSYNMGSHLYGKKLLEKDFPQFTDIVPFVHPHLVGFFSVFEDHYYFVFNTITGEITYLPQIRDPNDYIIQDWIATPPDFPGIENCE